MMPNHPTPEELRLGERTAWGPPPSAEKPGPRAPQILKFTPYRNAAGTMLGFFSVQTASGMIINSLRLMIGPAGKRWVAVPAEKAIDKSGVPVLDAKGKPRWNNFVEFVDLATKNKFQDLCLDLLRAKHPELFNGDGS